MKNMTMNKLIKNQKGIKLDKKDKNSPWYKPPRSSRICLRCEHKYSSHIDVKCLKIVQRKPERIECVCKGFITNQAEYDMVLEREARKKARLEKEQEENKILVKEKPLKYAFKQ